MVMRQVESKEGAEVERREVQNTLVFTVDGCCYRCGNHGLDGGSKAEKSVTCTIQSVC